MSSHLRDYKEVDAAEENETDNDNSTKSWKGRTMTPSKLKQQRQREAEMEGLRVEVVDMLKYWVVYAVLLAIVRTGKLLPFIGHVLNVTTDDDAASTTTGFFGKKTSGLYTKLRLPGKFVEEVSLMFFVWLRLMPAPIAAEVKENVSSALSPKKPSVSKASGSKPVDILYGKLSPIVLSAMNSSAFLTRKAFGESRDEGSTWASMICVMVRLISKGSKEWLITTIIESSALLPAVTTLFMVSVNALFHNHTSST